MINDSEWVRLARYVAGECTPEDGDATRRWIAASSEREQAAEALRAIGAASTLDAREWDTPVAWERLVARAARRRAITARAHQWRPLSLLPAWTGAARRSPTRIWRAAVAAGVLLGAAMVGRHLGLWPHHTRMAASAIAPAREFTTRRAQVAQVRLSDGTIVDLAPESRLTVPADYGSARREVSLDGEGLFAAVHDARLPFVARSGSAVVRDIGTQFVVRHYMGDSAVRVVVTDGSVRLSAPSAPSAADEAGPVLVRGDLGQVDGAGVVTVSHGVDLDRYAGWAAGRLTLYDIPLSDAVTQLARWYDVRFVLGDSALGRRRITISVPTTSVAGLVDAIGLALNLRAERVGDTITLHAQAR
jgi:ferric-dicitrate binding protein FerR (iron transport regulator)